MKKKISAYLQILFLILGFALILTGIINGIYTYFENWKYVLSDFAKIFLYWKMYLLIIAGVIFVWIGIYSDKK